VAGCVNKVVLIGHLGRDPEVRQSTQGDGQGKIVQLNVATTESWKDKITGERKDRTEWHRVVIFNENLASVAERYLKKGSKVYLEGQLQTRKWTDNSGQEKYTTEVILSRFRGELVLLDSRQQVEGSGDSAGFPGGGGSASASRSGASEAPRGDIFDDDIPF
jgi:single-strand DNA-binding protein